MGLFLYLIVIGLLFYIFYPKVVIRGILVKITGFWIWSLKRTDTLLLIFITVINKSKHFSQGLTLWCVIKILLTLNIFKDNNNNSFQFFFLFSGILFGMLHNLFRMLLTTYCLIILLFVLNMDEVLIVIQWRDTYLLCF